MTTSFAYKATSSSCPSDVTLTDRWTTPKRQRIEGIPFCNGILDTPGSPHPHRDTTAMIMVRYPQHQGIDNDASLPSEICLDLPNFDEVQTMMISSPKNSRINERTENNCSGGCSRSSFLLKPRRTGI
jgi:hypothetical protein